MNLIGEESLDPSPTSQLISDLSVLRVCNKTGGTIKGDIKKSFFILFFITQLSALLKGLADPCGRAV